jgi:hypothetical protein
MKRPNQYSKPLEGVRTESYHPADYTNNQYAKDLNTYIDYLEIQQERRYSEEEVIKILLKHQSDYRRAVRNTSPLDWSFDIKDWFRQFKKK